MYRCFHYCHLSFDAFAISGDSSSEASGCRVRRVLQHLVSRVSARALCCVGRLFSRKLACRNIYSRRTRRTSQGDVSVPVLPDGMMLLRFIGVRQLAAWTHWTDVRNQPKLFKVAARSQTKLVVELPKGQLHVLNFWLATVSLLQC